MRTRILTLAAVSLLLGSGCYRARFIVSDAKPGGAPIRQMHLNVLYGWVDLTGPLPIDQYCGGRAVTVDHQFGVIDLLINYVTTELVNPSTAEITCAKPKRAAREDEE